MGLRINTNVSSIASQRTLSQTKRSLNDNLRKLSSGIRINKAADDAAGLAISENLRAQIRSMRQAKRNGEDAISLIQTAEGGLSEVSNILIRLRELAIQAASDTLGDREREFSNIEFQNLKEEIERISQSNEYNGVKLLNGTSGILEFQIGIHNDPFLDRLKYDSTLTDATTASLAITQEDISTKIGAQTTIQKMDDSLVRINGIRSELGAKQNRLSSTVTNLEVNDENLSAANSRIRDTDIASESADMTRNKILLQSGIAVLAQANTVPNVALRLLNE